MLGNAGSTALPFLFCKGLKGGGRESYTLFRTIPIFVSLCLSFALSCYVHSWGLTKQVRINTDWCADADLL